MRMPSGLVGLGTSVTVAPGIMTGPPAPDNTYDPSTGILITGAGNVYLPGFPSASSLAPAPSDDAGVSDTITPAGAQSYLPLLIIGGVAVAMLMLSRR